MEEGQQVDGRLLGQGNAPWVKGGPHEEDQLERSGVGEGFRAKELRLRVIHRGSAWAARFAQEVLWERR